MKQIIKLLFLIPAITSLFLISCDKEFTDPTRASEPNVIGNVEGLTNLAAGLQRRFTIGRQSPLYNTVTAGGFVVYALKPTNSGNTSEVELETGKTAVTSANSIVTTLWAQNLITKKEAETILNNLGVV